jgi:hypothetical protein
MMKEGIGVGITCSLALQSRFSPILTFTDMCWLWYSSGAGHNSFFSITKS